MNPVSGFGHQLAMFLPDLPEFFEPVFHFSISIDDEECPLAGALPVVGAGAAGQLGHPVLDLINAFLRLTKMVVDDGHASFGKLSCFVNQDMFRAFLQGEAVVGIGEDEIATRELSLKSLKPRLPFPIVDRLREKNGATQNAGLLYRLN